MRAALIPLICLFGVIAYAGAGDPQLAGWNRGIAFLEHKVADDPDDFVAWNQLVDRYLRRARWTGDLEDLGRATRAAARSLAAIPAEQNLAGLAASGRAALAAHQFADARTIAERLRALEPEKS